MSERLIVTAALMVDGLVFTMPRPARHHHLFQALSEFGREAPDAEQGFLTSDGLFVRREPALRIAEKAGQITKKHGHPKQLFSEDIW